ncbi:MAG: FtsW/RodA/SpoVE family cell cycle protein [Phycisphaerae bacterium]|nr:FtsW/RodA/SpoVE family cell cycle protein [Phycisphaerae bacterium]
MLAATAGLIIVGLITIYSVGHPVGDGSANSPANDLANVWKKQLVYAGAGFAAFIAVNIFSYRRLGTLSYWAFGAVLVMLVVLLIGRYAISVSFIPEINGTHRWIRLPAGISIQPSEFFKISYIVALAWYLRYRSNCRNFKSLVGPFVLTLFPMMMILLEPDLGTVMLTMPILFSMLFVAGARVKHLLIIILLAILVSPLMWTKLQGYQRLRLSSLILQSSKVRQWTEENQWLSKLLVDKPHFKENDWKSGSGFQLIRSKYAIASGGAGGYGFRQGPFIKYDFLPFRQTDFIFSVFGHQWGFWGCLGVLGLYAVLVACGIEISLVNSDPFGRLIAIGITAMFAVEVLINVGMTVGVMPITGLTLPFMSYGGSSLVVSMLGVGLLNNIGRCRPFSASRSSFKYQAV